MPTKISLISLGCAKNLINSEQMLYLLTEAGFSAAECPQDSDVCIINTCGFIESARTEAIDTILEITALKKTSELRAVIVAGCLAERYRDGIFAELPEVDALLGVGSYGEIVSAVNAVLSENSGRAARGRRKVSKNRFRSFGDKNNPEGDGLKRVLSTGVGTAYIKIAEGCGRHCAFCVIPKIRGKYRSRTPESIISEAAALAESGVKELIIIAQDTSRYGGDLPEKTTLTALLRELCKLPFQWLRLHYLYPDSVDDELIELIASEPKILKYLDIPIQHIDDGVLSRMRRGTTSAQIRGLITKLRERIPDAVIRTSVIVGHPGEGEAEFNALCDFLGEYKLERVGVFVFSPEEGTPAFEMRDRCDTKTAQKRAGIVSEIQLGVMAESAQKQIGKTLDVFVCGTGGIGGVVDNTVEDCEVLWGRTYADAPDVDCRVIIEGDAEPGEIVSVKITAEYDGDLIGAVIR